MRPFKVAAVLLLALAALATDSTASTCPALDSCGCDWANAATCASDDGSSCWCACCCRFEGASGPCEGENAACVLPAPLSSELEPPKRNATNFAWEHGRLWVDADSKLLRDAHGRNVQLQGVSTNALHLFKNCYEKEAFEKLVSEWGVNVFRAAMFVGDDGYELEPEEMIAKITQMVEWAVEFGVYVIVDFHVLTPGDPREWLWLDGRGVANGVAVRFWLEMANLFRFHTNVLYEVASQPNGVSWREVLDYHDKIISQIRIRDPAAVVICGTPSWSVDVQEALVEGVYQRHNVMYAFQFYAGSHGNRLDVLFKASQVLPIFVTEWASTYASHSGGPFLQETYAFLRTLNGVDPSNPSVDLKRYVSWVAWSFSDDADSTSALLTGGACAAREWESTSCSGAFTKRYLQVNADEWTNSAQSSRSISVGAAVSVLLACALIL